MRKMYPFHGVIIICLYHKCMRRCCFEKTNPPVITTPGVCGSYNPFRTYFINMMFSSEPAHCSDVLMSTMASQITSLTIVYSTVYSGSDQRKHQSSASLAFVRGIHRSPVNSPHKWPVTRKKFPVDDVIMISASHRCLINVDPVVFVIWEWTYVKCITMNFIWIAC